MKRAFATAIVLLAGSVWLACGSTEDRAQFCTDGETRPCTCPGTTTPGAETCASGAYGACACVAPALPDAAPAPDGPAACGDGKCNGTETCRSCPHDCGECPKCPLAPSCTDAVGVPASPQLRGDLSQPPSKTDAGTTTEPGAGQCRNPELRLRIERVLAHKGGGEIYCVVSATDGATSEAAVTTKTRKLGDDETHYFDATTGLLWGQKELHPTTNNLTVTFNCFAVKSDAWSKVLQAMGDTATKLGGSATPYGWAFGLGGVAANAAAAAVQAGAGDELRFNAQQVIDKKDLLDLTNGRYWSLRKTGDCGLFCDWDWEIFVQSWGCADADPPKTP